METLVRLTSVLGSPCMRYLLGLGPTDAGDQLSVDKLTPEQSMVLQRLGDVIPFDGGQSVTDFQVRHWIVRLLGNYVPEAGCSWGVAIRRSSGGVVEDARSDDAVLRGLLPQLRDVYPILLLPRSRPLGGPDLFGPTFDHPSREATLAAVLADEDLGRLFPEESDSAGPSGYYLGPSSGGTIQLWSLAAQLFTMAYDWAGLESTVPTLDSVTDRLKRAVDLLRRAVRGETVTVPVRVALAGVLLPADVTAVEIGRARVRRRDSRDDRFADITGSDQKVVSALESGEQIEVNYAGDLVIETEMDYKVHLGEPVVDEWPADLSGLRKSLERMVDSIRLGLALTSHSADPPLVLQSWIVSLDPLAHGPTFGWRAVEQNHKIVPTQLTLAQVESWRRWAERLLDEDTSNIEIAIGRVLQAIGERQSLDDVLIDSVMAWENLFGAEQETTFRVCGSLAWLLENDVGQRKSLMKELKTIYALRSRIVHGSKSLDPAENALPRRAINIALEALRVVLQHRPDLLAEPDGPARSNRVLLGD